jgi:hypothetical protein
VVSGAFFGLGLLLLLALPWSRQTLEAGMPGHMLAQLPLLALCGCLLAGFLPPRARARLQAWNAFGITGITLAAATALFWMLPRSLDAALDAPGSELAKFLSLPLLLGLPLRLSWRRLTALGRGLVLSNLVAMLWVLAWLYLAAPVRVCSNYLRDEQALVGWGLLGLGSVVALWATGRLFIAPRRPSAGG